MKRLLRYILPAIFPLVLSCSGASLPSDKEESGDNSESLDPSSYYIYVDKTGIESDGIDKACFTIKNGKGDVLSTYDNMGSVFYENVATGVRLPRYSESFSSIRDGEFEFVGIYKGKKTVNSVSITSSNRASYELYHKNVAVFKLTATTCPNCPSMTDALNGLDDDAKDHSIVIACHNADQFSIKCGRSDVAGASALKVDPNLTTLALPSLVYDLAFMEGTRATSAISGFIMDRRINAPAEVGVKIGSFALDDDQLKVKAYVKADRAGNYDMTAAILCDGLYAPEGYSSDGYYNDVVIAINEENFINYTNSTGFALVKGQEYEREFIFTFSDGVPQADYLKRFRAVVLVHKRNDKGASDVNNAAICNYGQSQDYRLN